MGWFRRGVLALAGAAAAGLAAPAQAADLPVPNAYPQAVMPPARYDWTGIYLGAHVGVGLLQDSVAQSAGAAALTPLVGNINVSPFGVIGGAQLGVNFQFSSIVVGAEAAWTDSAITGNGRGGTGTATQERMTSAPLWFASATGRIGYAANDWLFYVKGGGALMNVKYTQDTLVGAGVTATSQFFSDTRDGFVIGGGIEYGLTENWSARLEYAFYDFGTKNYPFTQTPVSINSQLHTITFGVNYRLNWTGGWH